jgi:hypothetical protein
LVLAVVVRLLPPLPLKKFVLILFLVFHLSQIQFLLLVWSKVNASHLAMQA